MCKINQVIYFHRFTVDDLSCFWDDFVTLRRLCAENGEPIHTAKALVNKVKIKCDSALWYLINMTDPFPKGHRNYKRCGPKFENAR